jgi:hypothetical protein
MNKLDIERILQLQCEYRDEHARDPHALTLQGIADAVMEEALILKEDLEA